MTLNRRQFLALTAAFLAAPHLAWAERQLDILVLGGTGFIGPHEVESALGRGHRVTLFNRGRSNPYLFPQLEKLTGDRAGDLESLKGRKWDVVLDLSGFRAEWVDLTTELLQGNVDSYVFFSDISVYADQSRPGQTEEGALVDSIEVAQQNPNQEYGAIKAASEAIVRERFPDTHTILRLGIAVGPGDPTDRFTYWPVRVYRGGTVLAPGQPTDPVQFIDVRDLADWTTKLVERRQFGTFNVSGPSTDLTLGGFLDIARSATNSTAEFVWVSPEFLERMKVGPLIDLPLWVPPESSIGGFTQVDISKALAAGLTFRSLETTISDALAWYRTLPEPESLKAGLTPERERLLLSEWEAHLHDS